MGGRRQQNLTYIFTYGQLKPEYYPPHGEHKAIPDKIYADMYHTSENGGDAACINIGLAKKTIDGYTCLVPTDQVEEINQMEVRAKYKPVRTLTEHGYLVTVWEYKAKLPGDSYRIYNFTMDGKKGNKDE